MEGIGGSGSSSVMSFFAFFFGFAVVGLTGLLLATSCLMFGASFCLSLSILFFLLVLLTGWAVDGRSGLPGLFFKNFLSSGYF